MNSTGTLLTFEPGSAFFADFGHNKMKPKHPKRKVLGEHPTLALDALARPAWFHAPMHQIVGSYGAGTSGFGLRNAHALRRFLWVAHGKVKKKVYKSGLSDNMGFVRMLFNLSPSISATTRYMIVNMSSQDGMYCCIPF